jgi:hypothetical protein
MTRCLDRELGISSLFVMMQAASSCTMNLTQRGLAVDNCYAEQLQDTLFISPLLLSDVLESSWTLVQPQYVDVQWPSGLAQEPHHQMLFSSLCIQPNHFIASVNCFVDVIHGIAAICLC